MHEPSCQLRWQPSHGAKKFGVSRFENSNGTIAWRVSGWLKVPNAQDEKPTFVLEPIRDEEIFTGAVIDAFQRMLSISQAMGFADSTAGPIGEFFLR